MPADLSSILEKFYAIPPGSIRIVTTSPNTDIVKYLSNVVLDPPRSIEYITPIDGGGYVRTHPDFPTMCAVSDDKKYTADEIGVLLTHIELFRECLDMEVEALVVFSDNCVASLPKPELLASIQNYLTNILELEARFQMNGVRDLVLLGCDRFRQSIPIGHLVKATNNFQGWRAYCISRRGMASVIRMHDLLVSKGKIAALDNLFCLTLKNEKRHCMCPLNGEFFFKAPHLSEKAERLLSEATQAFVDAFSSENDIYDEDDSDND